MQKHAARHTPVLCERSPFLELMGWVCLHTAHVSLKPPRRKFSSETGPKSETWAASSLGHLSLCAHSGHTFLSWLSWSLSLSWPALLSLSSYLSSAFLLSPPNTSPFWTKRLCGQRTPPNWRLSPKYLRDLHSPEPGGPPATMVPMRGRWVSCSQSPVTYVDLLSKCLAAFLFPETTSSHVHNSPLKNRPS